VDPVEIPLHVGLLEGVIVVYDVPGAGIIFPHTNTLPRESVAENLFGSDGFTYNSRGQMALTPAGQKTLGLAPSIMQTFTQPAQTLARVGQAQDIRAQQPITEAMQRFAFEQAAPSQALQQYGNIVAGTILPGTITTTGPGTRGPGALAGAVGGAGIASALQLSNPYIAGAAILGGLLG